MLVITDYNAFMKTTANQQYWKILFKI